MKITAKYCFLMMFLGAVVSLSAADEAVVSTADKATVIPAESVASGVDSPVVAPENKMAWLEKYAADRREREAKQRRENAGKSITSLEIAPWRMWLAVVILGGMVAGLVIIMRKYGRSILPNSDATIISVKSKVQLDPRNSVSVLKVYDEEYVIGAGPNGVTLLAKLLPIDGVESEIEEPEGGLSEKKIERKFEDEFKLAESNIESREVK